MTLIATTDALAAACRRLAAHPFVTVDTAFLRETTFWPKLCVLQIASDAEAVVVDALAPGLDLESRRIRVDHALGHAIMVAKIDEQHAAEITDPVAPARQANLFADLGFAQGPAGVRTVAMHRQAFGQCARPPGAGRG